MKTDQLLRGPVITRGVSLPKELNEALIERSRQEDQSASRLIRRALLLYFSQDGDDNSGKQGEVTGEN